MKPSEKHADKIFYDQAGAEIQSGNIDRGLMVKAIAQCKGNKQKAELLYLEWRIELLKEEAIENATRLAAEQAAAEERQAKEAAIQE